MSGVAACFTLLSYPHAVCLLTIVLDLTVDLHVHAGLYQPTGSVGELYAELQRKLLTFDAMAAKTAVRRALVIGQVGR